MRQTPPRRATHMVIAATVLPMIVAGCARTQIEERPVTLAAKTSEGGTPPGIIADTAGIAEAGSRADAASPPSREAIADVIDAVFTGEGDTQSFILCAADRETRRCDDQEVPISGFGFGGILLPLVLEVDGLEITRPERAGEVWQISSDFDFTVNAIPPLCPDADGQISYTDAGVLSIRFDAFYCNWAIIGNVITQIDFAIEEIDPDDRSFSGSYAIQFNGTGNAYGTGYFRAIPTSDDTDIREATAEGQAPNPS